MQQPQNPAASARLRLIINADDFGIAAPTNDGIIGAHRDGALTSASLMACGEAFDHAVTLCLDNPSLDIGAHLTLVEETPVLGASEIPTLVDESGRFHRHATVFAARYFQGKISLDEVRRELNAQIAKIAAAGVPISHLDSHQHLHMLPGVLGVTQDISRRRAIPWVRFPREAIAPYMLRSPAGVGRIAQMAALNAFCGAGAEKIPHRTDHFAGFFFGGKLSKQNLLTLIKHLPASGVCEIMCHPGLDDPQSARAHWGYSWNAEFAALTDAEVNAALAARGVELTTYRDLPPPH